LISVCRLNLRRIREQARFDLSKCAAGNIVCRTRVLSTAGRRLFKDTREMVSLNARRAFRHCNKKSKCRKLVKEERARQRSRARRGLLSLEAIERAIQETEEPTIAPTTTTSGNNINTPRPTFVAKTTRAPVVESAEAGSDLAPSLLGASYDPLLHDAEEDI